MGLADLLRKQSIVRRQEINNETVKSIIEEAKKQASIAASRGERKATVDHRDLNRQDIKLQVEAALKEEGFVVSFFVDEHEDNDGISPPSGYTLYCVRIHW